MKDLILLGSGAAPRREKLLGYSALAGAFLAASADAEGQIVYTDLSPDTVIVNGVYDIDFDGDGVQDLELQQVHSASSSSSSSSSSVFDVAVAHVSYNSAAFMGAPATFISSSLVAPHVLAANTPVGPTSPDWLAVSYSAFLGYRQNTLVQGPWPGESGSIGFRFIAGDGMLHYAWVQLTVSDSASLIKIGAYAYQATPDSSLNTGDTGISLGIPVHREKGLSFQLFPNPTSGDAVIRYRRSEAGTYPFGLRFLWQFHRPQPCCLSQPVHRPHDSDRSSVVTGRHVFAILSCCGRDVFREACYRCPRVRA